MTNSVHQRLVHHAKCCPILRRALLGLAAIAALFVAGASRAYAQPMPQGPGAAQAWPTAPVHIVVPSPAGSGIDAVARMLAKRLSDLWGQAVVVDNRPGANSIIGTEAVARSAPDGYTLLFASDSVFTVNPHMYARLPYDAVRDFVPIAQVATFHQLLVARPSLGANNLAGAIAIARARPGIVTYASYGVGSAAHLLSELLRSQTHTDLLHVPYKGIAQSVAAVVAGESDLTWAGVYSTQAHVRAGRLRALAIAAPARSHLLPQVPTFAELGYPAIDYPLWYGLFAPARMSPGLLDRIQRDVAGILRDRAVRELELLAKAYEPSDLTPAQFADKILREGRERAALVKASGALAE
jgi:tripartite-type tricarboxylate transporter receptor subunit TctC